MELFQEIKKEYGVLVVQSKPAGADVYINDSKDPAGITPLTIGCKAGSTKIRVKKGKKEKKEILRVIAGEKTASSIFILKGGSSLLLVLGGIVLAGGAGAALLLKGKPGEEGEAPTTGIIQVNSSPTGSSVYLDGTDTGKTTNCALTFVSPGSHTIELVKEGYEDYQQNISVTAGQTTTVNANLTKHTITVTSPASSTIWIKGDEVEITWETSGSAISQGNVCPSTGLSPLSYPGRNLSPSFQRRAFRHNPSFRGLIRTRRGLESSNLSKNEGTILNKFSNLQDVSKKLSSHAKENNIVHQREKNIGIIEKNKGFSSINLPLSPGTSFISSRHLPQALERSGIIKALTLTDVKIELYKGTSLVQTIASSSENDGSYTWTVDPSLADGTDYKVRISCASDPDVYGESNDFTIEQKSITVTEPTSSTIWSQGDSADITWTSTGAISNVKIDLYKGITLNQTIVLSTENDGSYTWTEVDSSLADDSDYKVRISCASDPDVYGESNDFTIEQKSITVTEPTSSTIWTKGFSANITWTSTGAISNVKIDLYKAIILKQTVVSNTENNGSYTWTVDPSHTNGTDYKVRISDVIDSGVYGESDEFEITHGYVFVTKWGSEGSGNGQFKAPVGIAAAGYVYVVDKNNARIQKFTSEGTFVTSWGSHGGGNGQFIEANGIAVDESGYVYVSEIGNRRIQKFTSDGAFVTKWGNHGSEDGQFYHARGVAVDGSGYVYVADSENCRIQKFTSDGTFITKWGSSGSGESQFNHPTGIAVDTSGYVYVADNWNHRIQKFTSDGAFVNKWGSQGSGDGQFIAPLGIAADKSGYVYVAEDGNSRIQKFTSEGTFVTKWGNFGGGDGQLRKPEGIAVDESGYVYVADKDNHRIQKFGPISSGSALTGVNSTILNSNLVINKNSFQKFPNIKSPLQNRLKNQKKQPNREIRKNKERINREDRKNEKRF